MSFGQRTRRACLSPVSKFRYQPGAVDGELLDTPGVEARIHFRVD